MTPNKNIAVIGFGNQGRPWAQNLRDSGWDVTVLLRPQSLKKKDIENLQFKTASLDEASKYATLALLVPDNEMPALCTAISPFLKPGQTLVFAHGFTLHFKTAPWPKDCNHLLLAPKGIGNAVREKFLAGSGVPCVLSFENQVDETLPQLAQRLCEGLGASRAGVYPSNAKDEVIADLFSEQTLLCGGVPALVFKTFEKLTHAGIDPSVAYLECVHELGFMADLFQKKGFFETLLKASPTAQFGGMKAFETLFDPATEKNMDQTLKNIVSGDFKQQLEMEAKNNFTFTQKTLEKIREAQIEKTGSLVRKKINGELA